jgi:hypothetical protein
MVLINQKDCSKTIKNLGVPDCVVQNGRVTGFIAVSPNWSIDIDTDSFTEALVNEWIQDGTFVPVLGAVEVPNGTPEDTTEEFQGGIMAVVRSGLPMFTFKFIKGWSYSRALYSMNSFQAYKLLLVFEDGSIAGAINGSVFSGYSLGMLNTGTFFHTDGNTSGYSNTIIQLTSASEYNLDTAVLDRSSNGFNANNLLPITDIVMSGRADVSEGKVYIKALFDMNRGNVLGGITIANLRCTINGVVDTITALSLVYEPSTKEYSFTPTTTLTTSQSVVVQLYDAVNTVATAKIGTRYYKGVTPAITPVS